MKIEKEKVKLELEFVWEWKYLLPILGMGFFVPMVLGGFMFGHDDPRVFILGIACCLLVFVAYLAASEKSSQEMTETLERLGMIEELQNKLKEEQNDLENTNSGLDNRPGSNFSR